MDCEVLTRFLASRLPPNREASCRVYLWNQPISTLRRQNTVEWQESRCVSNFASHQILNEYWLKSQNPPRSVESESQSETGARVLQGLSQIVDILYKITLLPHKVNKTILYRLYCTFSGVQHTAVSSEAKVRSPRDTREDEGMRLALINRQERYRRSDLYRRFAVGGSADCAGKDVCKYTRWLPSSDWCTCEPPDYFR